MPYKNIVFAKLEKRLFNDHRWYMMSELSQLNYIRFILFAAETYNKIPKNLEAIKKAFKSDQDLKTIENTIKEIKQNYPKFKETKHFYYFDGFEEKTNYIPHRVKLGKSQGLPKDGVYIDKEEEEDKDKNFSHICKTFYSKHKEVFKKDYVANFGKDGKIFKELEKIIPKDELIILIDKFFASTDEFIIKAGYTTGVFKSVINKLRNERPKAIVRYE